MEPLFKDSETQAGFDENGYVIVPYLNKAEVGYLQEVYNEHFSGKTITGLYPTHSRNSIELSMEISDIIQAVFKRRNDELLNDYRFFIGHFMVKSHVESREFELHQDWCVVEEDKFNVAQIWCPLIDTYPENGGMFLIEKSHRFFTNYRSGSLFRFHYKVNEKTEKHLTQLRVKAGEALFYHNRLIHGSYPNMSHSLRAVAMGNVAAKAAEYLYFQKSATAPNQVDIYKVEPDTFLRNLKIFEGGNIPAQLNLIKSLPYRDDEISEQALLDRVADTSFTYASAPSL